MITVLEGAFGRISAKRTLVVAACLTIGFAEPAVAEKSNRVIEVRTVSSVQASGRGSSKQSDVRNVPRQRVQEEIGGLLDASSATPGLRTRTDDDRRNATRQRSIQNARIELIRNTAFEVQEALNLTNVLHEQYLMLKNMSPEDVARTFPDGSHLELLQATAKQYNASVDAYYLAVSRHETAKAQLSGGQELHGSALDELNALLGQ